MIEVLKKYISYLIEIERDVFGGLHIYSWLRFKKKSMTEKGIFLSFLLKIIYESLTEEIVALAKLRNIDT